MCSGDYSIIFINSDMVDDNYDVVKFLLDEDLLFENNLYLVMVDFDKNRILIKEFFDLKSFDDGY